MSINLIDTLLDEQPRIDWEGYRIYSDVPLSNIIGETIPGESKSEYVLFQRQLDKIKNEENRYDQLSGSTYRTHYNYYSSDHYEDIWRKLNLGQFVISSRLLRFFTKESDNSIIKIVFNMDMQFFKDKDAILRVYSELVDKFNYLKEGKDGYLIYGKKEIKIRYGKFVNMLYKLMYGDKDNGLKEINQQEIEKSVDFYKTKFNTGGYRVSVLVGDDIKLGYDRKFQLRKTDTMLYQSCMNDKPDFLNLYAINTEKIYLLVITNDDGKIISRNLMWRLKKYNNFLFDRVYAVDNYVRNASLKIAELENWITYVEGVGVTGMKKIGLDGEAKKVNNSNLKIKLNFNGVNRFPYLDTFMYQRRWGKTLTNKRLYRYCYKYEQTGGGRTKR